MSELVKHFALAFSALLPLLNPPGSAMEFLGIVGLQSKAVYKRLALRIAMNTVLVLAVFGLAGSYLLEFFGISVDILEVAGGMVVAAMGWSLLNQPEAENAKEDDALKEVTESAANSWDSRTFYPLAFPLTAGPGCIAVMLTLSAHVRNHSLSFSLFAYGGLMLAVLALSALVYVCYAYAPTIARKVSPGTVHGVLRVIAFILFCIGVQIAWNGLRPLLMSIGASAGNLPRPDLRFGS
jgi:multiple antibiotic resistance protein